MQPTEAQLLERRIWRHFSKGLTQYHLLDDGDHILLGLSGGKDSLALLDFMSRRARIHRPKLTLTALHVRMANIDYESDTAYLEDFAAARGVRLIVRETSFDPSTDTRKSPCFLCSWNRRKMLFTVAQELGTMPARLQMRKFPMTIIRPLCMVHERDLAAWAALQGYRKQKKLCPYETDSHRSDIKQIFGQLEQLNPEARYSLWNALEQEGKLVE